MITTMNRQEPGQTDSNGRPNNSAAASNSGTATPYVMNTSQATNNLVGLAGANPAPAARNNTSTLPGGRFGAIWGDVSGRGFPTARQPNNQAGNTTRTGSSLLLDDSTTDSWTESAGPSSQRLHGLNRQDISSVAVPRSQAPTDAAIQSTNGATSSSATLPSRPPAINLNGVNGHQSRPSFGANFTNPSNFSGFEQPPSVYTKSDRPPPPAFHAQPGESTVRRPGSAQPSPAEERRSWLSNSAVLTHQSMPGSRNSSLPPSRDGDEQQLHIGPVGRIGSDQYRRQSNPHANMLMSNAALQFSQISLDDVRSNQPLPTNGSIGSAAYDAALSDTASHAHYSRRGSAQIEPPLTTMHGDNAIGTEMHAQPPFARQRFDAAVGSQSRPLSYVSQPSSRRDSAQSREFQVSGGYGGVNFTGWGQMDHRLRGFPTDAPGFNEPRFGQYQSARHPGYPFVMNQQHGTQHGAMLPPFQQGHMYGQNAPQFRDSNEGSVSRSRILDDYKNGGRASKKYELRDVFGHIVEFSGDQHGSRFIQAKLETASSEEKGIVFKEILPDSLALMTDVFGNYVIQKLFEHGDQVQKRSLAEKMKGRVVFLSVQMYGCRVVQKALEHVLSDQQASLVAELERDVMRCVKDQNGNHVIQKAIERCPSDAIRFIFDAFVGQILQLSVHAYGCRVIQRCLEFCEPKDKDAIMEELHTGMSNLIIDQFGNYVVQHVVEHGKDEDRRILLDIVSTNLEQFSKHKFASNVVEKCLTHGGAGFQKVVLERLLAGSKRHPESTVLAMVKDSYGNYVIQKLLDVLPQREYVQFIDSIQVDLTKARRSGAGKQVASIEKKMHKFPYQTNAQVRNDQQGRAVSGERTPALTFTSVQSSAISSVNGDAVDGNQSSRKNSIHG